VSTYFNDQQAGHRMCVARDDSPIRRLPVSAAEPCWSGTRRSQTLSATRASLLVPDGTVSTRVLWQTVQFCSETKPHRRDPQRRRPTHGSDTTSKT
jgi:hypothetical protein